MIDRSELCYTSTMATLSRAEAKRARASKHASRSRSCSCGKVCWGNGGYSAHARVCKTYREVHGVFVPDWQFKSLLEEGYRSEDIRLMAMEAAAEGRDRL